MCLGTARRGAGPLSKHSQGGFRPRVPAAPRCPVKYVWRRAREGAQLRGPVLERPERARESFPSPPSVSPSNRPCARTEALAATPVHATAQRRPQERCRRVPPPAWRGGASRPPRRRRGAAAGRPLPLLLALPRAPRRRRRLDGGASGRAGGTKREAAPDGEKRGGVGARERGGGDWFSAEARHASTSLAAMDMDDHHHALGGGLLLPPPRCTSTLIRSALLVCIICPQCKRLQLSRIEEAHKA